MLARELQLAPVVVEVEAAQPEGEAEAWMAATSGEGVVEGLPRPASAVAGAKEGVPSAGVVVEESEAPLLPVVPLQEERLPSSVGHYPPRPARLALQASLEAVAVVLPATQS